MSSKLLIDGMVIPFSTSLAVAIGLNEAIVLQQIHYLLNIPEYAEDVKGRRWVFGSLPSWQERFFPFWSESTVKRTINSLREKRLLLCDTFNEKSYDRTLWYTIDYRALDEYAERPSGQNDLTNTKENTKIAKIAKRDKLKLISAADVRTSDRAPQKNISKNNRQQKQDKTKTDDVLPLFPDAKASPQKSDPVGELIEVFKEVTGLGIPPNLSGASYNKLWRMPLHEIYTVLCEGDMVAAKTLVADVSKHLTGEGLTVHNPNSIIRTARSFHARKKLERKTRVKSDDDEGLWI